MIRSITILLIIEIASLASAADDAASVQSTGRAVDIGSRRELFVEDGLIDRLVGKAELRLHHPVPREVAVKHDEPWEGSGTVYHSIFKDGDQYRMYYAAGQLTVTANGVDAGTHGQFCCYAESEDGVHWRKPALGLHEFQGSNANNIMMVRQKVGDAISEPGEPAVFKDENPDALPDARYKALLPANRLPTDHRRGLLAFKSPDGLHWSPMSDKPILTNGAFDSQNLAFWDAEHGHYQAYWRNSPRAATIAKKSGIRRGIVRFAQPCRRTSFTGRTSRICAMSIRLRSNSIRTRSSLTIAHPIC